MNPNPYPQGRWTQVVAAAAARKNARPRLMPESVASLVQAPLKELFWGIPESRLFEDARHRLDQALDLAIAQVHPATASHEDVQPELAMA